MQINISSWFYLFYFAILPIIVQIKNAAKSATTIVDPTGVPAKIEINKPITEQITEIQAEQIVTDLKLLNMRIALKAGKITNAEINKEPTKFIAKTMIIAIITAITRL